MVLEVGEGAVQLPEFVFRLLSEARIGGKPVWMPHLDQVAICLFDGMLRCTRGQPEYPQPLVVFVVHAHMTLSAPQSNYDCLPAATRKIANWRELAIRT